MPDYKEIYNDVVNTNSRYTVAQNSPGFRIVLQSEPILIHLAGRSLDVGCGVGFAFEYLCNPQFQFDTYGVDISNEAIGIAKQRLRSEPRMQNLDDRLKVIDSQTLPFEDQYFSLVTCFDVLEHLDEPDIDATLAEINRTMMTGGTLLCAVSCRKAGTEDKFGDNLHRTVESTDWWMQKIQPKRAIFDGQRKQLIMWKNKAQTKTP